MQRYRQLLADSRKDYQSEAANGTRESNKLNNILMQLRKMACHPLLHRFHYTNEQLLPMSKDTLRHEDYWDSDPNLVYEDMTVMTDYELHHLCSIVPPLSKYRLPDDVFFNCGKIKKLLEILEMERQCGSRVLIFSQLTMMLDVLEEVLQLKDYLFLRIDGQTPVNERQERIDTFYRDDKYFVFLLSTKAGIIKYSKKDSYFCRGLWNQLDSGKRRSTLRHGF
jgi:SWI/SNF-related matrix-associated actin-dependent regulator 1 of chromatin subfamily A